MEVAIAMNVGSVAEVETTKPLSEVERIIAQGYKFVEKIPSDTDLGKYFNSFFTDEIHSVELRLIEEGEYLSVYQKH